jgi:hypothetical protein
MLWHIDNLGEIETATNVFIDVTDLMFIRNVSLVCCLVDGSLNGDHGMIDQLVSS